MALWGLTKLKKKEKKKKKEIKFHSF